MLKEKGKFFRMGKSFLAATAAALPGKKSWSVK